MGLKFWGVQKLDYLGSCQLRFCGHILGVAKFKYSPTIIKKENQSNELNNVTLINQDFRTKQTM